MSANVAAAAVIRLAVFEGVKLLMQACGRVPGISACQRWLTTNRERVRFVPCGDGLAVGDRVRMDSSDNLAVRTANTPVHFAAEPPSLAQRKWSLPCHQIRLDRSRKISLRAEPRHS